MVKTCFIVIALGAFLLLPVASLAQKGSSNANTGSSLGLKTSGGHVSTPQNSPATGGAVLGLVEGVLSFCQKIHQPAAGYQQIDQLFTSGQSGSALAQVRDGDSYESAFRQITKQLQGLPANQASAVCTTH